MPGNQTLTPEELALLDHSTRGGMLLTTHWTLTAFASAFLIARLWAKLAFKRGLWWDDWVLLAGWVSFSTFQPPSAYKQRENFREGGKE